MAKITQWWLTTTDNKFDPFEEFDEWYHRDEIELRYATTGLIARFNTAPYDAPEYVIQESNKRAIGIILRDIPLPSETATYKVVTREIEVDDD